MIERAGASELLERAFRGFAALPAPAEAGWWEILGVPQDAEPEAIRIAYRDLVRKHHPDAGGDVEEFRRIQAAYEVALMKR